MNENIWIFIVIGLAVILGVLLYNMYREDEYRRQVRKQFGHSDKDALMESRTESVRDGKVHGKQGAPVNVMRQTDLSEVEPKQAAPQTMPSENGEQTAAVSRETPAAETAAAEDLFDGKPAAEPVLDSGAAGENVQKFAFRRKTAAAHAQEFVSDKRDLLLDIDDMAKQELSWFDARFDYLAYVSLREPHELHSLPRLSSRHRFQIAGCTMDNRWQIAEPIPSVYYQGFVVGMQAISRSGLATVQDLEAFGGQVNAFAEKMNGALKLTDIEAFLATARPLDEVCERVDQTIAIHLVSPTSVSGVELRAAVERAGFELSSDGAFYLSDNQGNPLFSIVNLDNSAFTGSLLDSKAYRGFSVLFDVPNVPAGKEQFNRFMDLVLSLATELSLDLVNDKLEELSTEWLKKVCNYVLARQEEMQKIGIEPGSHLANRLFS